MPEQELEDSRTQVIQTLQSGLTTPSAAGPIGKSPGSFREASAERAIGYALSPARAAAAPQFLERDVLRNAKAAVARSARAEARAVMEVAAMCAPVGVAFDGQVQTNLRVRAGERCERPGVRTSGPGGRAGATALVDTMTPEDVVIARDAFDRLRTAVAKVGSPQTAAVLDGMYEGESVGEAAARLGVSTRTIDRARDVIRSRAAIIFPWAAQPG